MSKLIDALRSAGVFNPYDFYGNEPYIAQRVKGGNRDVLPSAWRVYRHGETLSTWYDCGAKSFSYSGREMNKAALSEAQTWAAARYNISEWIRDPFGSYGSREFVLKRIAELKGRVTS